MKPYRMIEPCAKCPFNSSGPGLTLRKTLRPERWSEIKESLLRGDVFYCHNTTDGEDTDDGEYMTTGNELICAGSIEWQDRHGISSQYLRICERLDAIKNP